MARYKTDEEIRLEAIRRADAAFETAVERGKKMAEKLEPVAGVHYDPDKPMEQDDYAYFTSTGHYEGNGWAEQQRACPPQDAQQTGAIKYAQVYWRHFWNAQRMTCTHLFAYRENGYATKSPEEGKTLCGRPIPSYYHTTEGARDVCMRCQRIADKRQSK